MRDGIVYPSPAFYGENQDADLYDWMAPILPNLVKVVSSEVKGMLHASRDCLRNQQVDTAFTAFNAANGYYGEAFGVMRGLHLLGYGYFGAVNINGEEDRRMRGASQREHNLNWWFHQLTNEVLVEENFHRPKDHPEYGRCEYCLQRYNKDDRSIREKSCG